MSAIKQPNATSKSASEVVQTEGVFKRFTPGQQWEHLILILSVTVLLLTGLPQKYYLSWGYRVLTTPDNINLVRQIHHIAALVLTLEVLYHLGRTIYLLARRKLSADMFPTMQDVRDAWQILKYLLFMTDKQPAFGKYNFEQKITYWFLFFGVGIMVITGFILWFPLIITRVLPGAVIPAANLAHSDEAIAAAVFVVIWHVYHVHIERLNLSIFTGWLNEREMRQYHLLEYERLTGKVSSPSNKNTKRL
jgi:formate dehydrogenase gamma subunit